MEPWRVESKHAPKFKQVALSKRRSARHPRNWLPRNRTSNCLKRYNPEKQPTNLRVGQHDKVRARKYDIVLFKRRQIQRSMPR